MHDTGGETPKPKGGSSGDRAFQIFLMIACAALAVMVLLLAMQNRSLKQQLSAGAKPQIPPDALKQGDRFAPISLLDEGGSAVEVAFTGGSERTLLLFFSTQCPACRQTVPTWGELLKTPPSNARVFGVRLGPPSEDMPELPFAALSPADGGKSLKGKIPFIPATVVVDGKGVVERIWFGVLDEETQKELRSLLG